MIRAFRSFYSWWKGELAEMASGRAFRAPRRVEIVSQGADFTAFESSRGRQRQITHASPDSPPRARDRRRLKAAAARADEVVLRLPARAVLRPRLRIPAAEADALPDAIAREMDRQTPFAAGDVVFDWKVTGTDDDLQHLEVETLVARRSDLDRAVEAAAALGVAPDRITGPEQTEDVYNLASRESRRRPAWGYAVLKPLALMVILLGGTWIYLSIDRREADLAALQNRVDALRAATAEITALDRRIETLATAEAALDGMKVARPPAVAILSEATERLPDDTWLTHLSLDGDKLGIRGFSGDASRLLAILEASPYFTEVAFDAPVSRDARIAQDQFSIEARVMQPAVSQ